MSTSISLLDQNFNADDVDTKVFEHSVLFPPCRIFYPGRVWLIDVMVQTLFITSKEITIT